MSSVKADMNMAKQLFTDCNEPTQLGFYTVDDTHTSGREKLKRAIRPILYEDRILAVEQKFFCDRTTEKTITLKVEITDSGRQHIFTF